MGHANGGSGAPLMLSAASEMWEQYGGSSYSSFVYVDYYTQNIASGLSRTPTEWKNTFTEYDFTNNYYTEAYTTNYASANPFVGLSSFYYTDSIGVEGVEGHDYAFYPQQIESNGSSLTTYGYDPNDPLATGDNMDSCSFSSIWGFRDLFGPNDMAPSNPDAVAVSGDTLYVTVSGGDVRVSPAYSGSAVATIRGEFSEAADGYYNFTKGAAALSPTVTATWGDGGHFRVSQTGTFDFENISLNAPSFKFFSPEETSGTSGLGLSYSSNGLEMTFNPSENDAVFALNLPFATVEVDGGTADRDGNLTFKGRLSITTIFDGAKFEMSRLGYGLGRKSHVDAPAVPVLQGVGNGFQGQNKGFGVGDPRDIFFILYIGLGDGIGKEARIPPVAGGAQIGPAVDAAPEHRAPVPGGFSQQVQGIPLHIAGISAIKAQGGHGAADGTHMDVGHGVGVAGHGTGGVGEKIAPIPGIHRLPPAGTPAVRVTAPVIQGTVGLGHPQ